MCKQAGHMAQFCTLTIQPQVPPYRPPHHMNPLQGNCKWDKGSMFVALVRVGMHLALVGWNWESNV
jgi:hypothetical protein